MKWLYRIFRLFICPHRFSNIDKQKIFTNIDRLGKWEETGMLYTQQCKYCGKLKSFKSKVNW